MNRAEMEKEISTIIKSHQGSLFPSPEAEVMRLLKKEGWKAPDAPDTERKALIRENSDHHPPVEYYQEKIDFLRVKMLERFQKMAFRGGWENDCLFDFINKINDTAYHLHLAIDGFYPKAETRDLVIKECADLANYAVILADIARIDEKARENEDGDLLCQDCEEEEVDYLALGILISHLQASAVVAARRKQTGGGGGIGTSPIVEQG